MKPETLRIFYHPAARLRLTVGEEKSYISVKPVWAAPLSRPGKYLALLDGKDQEVVLLAEPEAPPPDGLPPESLAAVREELRRRYLTAIVTRVVTARQEFGATYWDVETDRGQREFITQNLQENALWISDDHLLLLDVDGSRFEIPRVSELDVRSRGIIDGIL